MPATGHLFIVSGPSGTGKSTLLNTIRKKGPSLRYSISYTTRPPRGDEQDGVQYHFISEAAFREKLEDGELAEWAEVHGHLYGTSAMYIEQSLSEGCDVLLDIDVQGAKQLRAKFPKAVSVFIMPPSMKELERRLMKRGTDSPETVARRLKNAEAEMVEAGGYDHVLVNDVLSETIGELERLLEGISLHG
jgi:guanylate kinase